MRLLKCFASTLFMVMDHVVVDTFVSVNIVVNQLIPMLKVDASVMQNAKIGGQRRMLDLLPSKMVGSWEQLSVNVSVAAKHSIYVTLMLQGARACSVAKNVITNYDH